jgi:multidrug resistance efflux pump
LKVRQQQAAISIAELKQRGAEALYQRQKLLYEKKTLAEELLKAAEAERDGAATMVEVEKARLEELKLHSDDARLGIDRVQAEVDLAEVRRDQAKLALDEHIITAPLDGWVLRIQVGVGDMFTAQPLQPPIIFRPDTPLIIRAEVDQEDAARIQMGARAIVSDDTGATKLRWDGKVAYVSGWLARRRSVLLEPDQLNDVRTLECIIEVDRDSGLRIGQRVRVEIPQRGDAE